MAGQTGAGAARPVARMRACWGQLGRAHLWRDECRRAAEGLQARVVLHPVGQPKVRQDGPAGCGVCEAARQEDVLPF